MHHSDIRKRMLRWIIQILWFIYSVVFAFLAMKAIEDDVQLGYPAVFTVPAAICFIIAAIGIIFHALNWRAPQLVLGWRRIFPLLLAMPLIGLVMDAVIPTDYSFLTHGLAWLPGTAFAILLVAPAYYANFRFAYDRP
jgi:hypothetical protein